MSKDFVLKGIVLPVAIAVGICVIFTVVISAKFEFLLPASDGADIAYYDNLSLSDELVNPESGELKANDLVGKINSFGELNLRYNADYSALEENASLIDGSVPFGKTGCVYIKINNNNVGKIDTASPLTVTTADGEYVYNFKAEKVVKNENEAKSLAPKGEKSLVIFYRAAKGIGLSSDYYALIFKGE